MTNTNLKIGDLVRVRASGKIYRVVPAGPQRVFVQVRDDGSTFGPARRFKCHTYDVLNCTHYVCNGEGVCKACGAITDTAGN